MYHMVLNSGTTSAMSINSLPNINSISSLHTTSTGTLVLADSYNLPVGQSVTISNLSTKPSSITTNTTTPLTTATNPSESKSITSDEVQAAISKSLTGNIVQGNGRSTVNIRHPKLTYNNPTINAKGAPVDTNHTLWGKLLDEILPEWAQNSWVIGLSDASAKSIANFELYTTKILSGTLLSVANKLLGGNPEEKKEEKKKEKKKKEKQKQKQHVQHKKKGKTMRLGRTRSGSLLADHRACPLEAWTDAGCAGGTRPGLTRIMPSVRPSTPRALFCVPSGTAMRAHRPVSSPSAGRESGNGISILMLREPGQTGSRGGIGIRTGRTNER
jgi:hypothetical protein